MKNSAIIPEARIEYKDKLINNKVCYNITFDDILN